MSAEAGRTTLTWKLLVACNGKSEAGCEGVVLAEVDGVDSLVTCEVGSAATGADDDEVEATVEDVG